MQITKLSKTHDRANFDCGNDEINNFLKRQASQGDKKHVSATHILANGEKNIIGFYTLSSFVLDTSLKDQFKLKYPYDVISVKLARMGVDKRHQGHGHSKTLIFDALMKTASISSQVGNMGLFVDAKDESLKSYYQKIGFIPIDGTDLDLWMPITTINKLLN